MTSIVYIIPVPSTSFVRGPSFEKLGGRRCSLGYDYETKEADALVTETILFAGVEGFKCTYYTSNSAEVFEAYDRIVDLGTTRWLMTISHHLESNGGSAKELKHFALFFDDGPYWEFICNSLEIGKSTSETR
jgi:hypothetical protein